MSNEQSSRTLGDAEWAPHSRNERWPARFLQRLIGRLAWGRLTIVTPQGQHVTCAGRGPGADAIVMLHRWRTVRRLLTGGDIALAEAYIDGDWSSPDLASLIELVARNEGAFRRTITGFVPARLANRLHHALKRNTRRGSRRNIAAHYDLGNAFYARWLDRDMNYSSALFTDPDQTLESGQAAKQDAVIAALDLRGGERVLEIGCGWGSLAERLASLGCEVTAITLSPAQLDYARTRLAASGVDDRTTLRLQDYRDTTGQFDRIVSIEMIEAVGRHYWPAFFGCLRDRLKPEGVAVLQAITMADQHFDQYASAPDFIQRYIFPGGMLPSRRIMTDQATAAGLTVAETLSFGQSYARTLAEWRTRFLTSWSDIQALGFDLRFKRMWDYYLAYCEGGFRSDLIDVSLWRLGAGTR